MEDFIFGTLATDAQRLADTRRRRAGVTHLQARFPRAPRPGQPVTLELTIGPAQPAQDLPPCERAVVRWSAAGPDSPETITPMEPAGVEWDTLLWGYVRRFRAILPGQPAGTVVRYRLVAQTAGGQEVPADGGAHYAYLVGEYELPDWTRDAVVYEIFVDRFYPGEGRTWQRPDTPAGFYGGTLRGVTEKMDYIAGLGVNVLWLTPIFTSPSHHGYDATSLFDIEPRLGSRQDLAGLLAAAHARGIRVLLDFVPNHWSSEHPTFQAAISDPDSPYVPWYHFTSWPGEYTSFFGVKSLPQLNLRYPPARQHLLDAAAHWLEFGVDGYRLDYASGPSPDFWADFRRVTRQVKPDCWTFGEVVEPSNAQLAFHGQLDGCLDFMLLEGLRQTFAFGRWDAGRFESFLSRHEAYFPADFSRPSFLDNHDMNRILWTLGGDKARLKLAALCQFTLEGPPVVYYGTEVGLSQERDVRQGERGIPEESRLPMLWGESQDQDLFEYYRGLIALRKEHPALRRGRRRSLHARHALHAQHALHALHASDSLLAYERVYQDDSLAVVLNLSGERRAVSLPGTWGPVVFSTGEGYRQAGGAPASLELPPWSGLVLGGLPA